MFVIISDSGQLTKVVKIKLWTIEAFNGYLVVVAVAVVADY